IAEEYRVRYAIDRVETLSTVWMGLTTGCAVCHDHKFDPISQVEFFQLYAYYNSVADQAMDGNALLPPPSVQVLSDENRQKLAEFSTRIAGLEQKLKDQVASVTYTEPAVEPGKAGSPRSDYVWVEDSLPPGAAPAGDGGADSWKFVTAPEHPVHTGQRSVMRTSPGRSQHFFTSAKPPLVVGAGDVLFAWVYLDPESPPAQVMLQFNDGSWEHRAAWGEDKIDWGAAGTPSRRMKGELPPAGEWVRLEVTAEEVGLKPGSKINGWACTQFGGTVYWDTLGVVTETPQEGRRFDSLARWEALQQKEKGRELPAEIKTAVLLEADKRTPEQQKQVLEWFLVNAWSGSVETLAPLNAELTEVRKQQEAYQKQIPATLVMQEMPNPRECFVLTRGQYDAPDKDQPVQPGVPAVLPPLPEDAPANRLALAKWLVRGDHPLTARVTVNRLWQQFFGTGLVKTAEDFGVQGERPSHPELLDWLAVEFVDSGWDVRKLIRLIVTSATYRQTARVLPVHLEKDPQNRLLARGPRFRLDAEMIRDQALALSGLLVRDVGGPSVKPYQPDGLWKAVGYTNSNTAVFKRDSGSSLYRRSLYTFWKRTAPPPSMSTFDAPSREACSVRRSRTNTPLQALLLMNDVQFVEAARTMAERILREGGETSADRLRFAFRIATARLPDAEEQATLEQVFAAHLAHYRSQPEAAAELLKVGESTVEMADRAAELAAWTMISSLILNLDETVTRG
ncbi:MAG: DUF1553 domain-containing protein, partial [Planctomycetaceae bacterium]|nr:DUF1553 domain-containing protein [Planctomycetaceae bacterium]